MFVDDGSKDRTWEIIQELYKKNEEIKGLRFAHNRGHQNAILAGMTIHFFSIPPLLCPPKNSKFVTALFCKSLHNIYAIAVNMIDIKKTYADLIKYL